MGKRINNDLGDVLNQRKWHLTSRHNDLPIITKQRSFLKLASFLKHDSLQSNLQK
jgi:hypothetical protein